MFPVLFSLGPITISTFGFFAFLSFVVSSFFLWESLRDDYPEEDIISFTIFLGFGVVFGARLFYILTHLSEFPISKPLQWLALRGSPGLSFLGAIFGGILFLYFWTKKKDWNLYLVADVLVFAFFWVLVILGVGLILSQGELFFIALFGLSLLILVFAFFLSRNYRKYIWYKSGKPGFIVCTSLAVFFGGYLLLEILFGRGVYLEKVVFLTLALFCLVFLYKRSERSLKEDFRTFCLFCQNLRKKK